MMINKRYCRDCILGILLLFWSAMLPVIISQKAVFASGQMEMKGENNDTIRKVMNAMLAIQRRAWEQGVASQALLELGEKDLVILLAKDAVVNQKKEGRFGCMPAISA